MRPASTPDANPLPAVVAALAGMRGLVVLVDLQGRPDVQCWGGVLAVAAQRFGVRGALVNGAVRDVSRLAQVGFPVFARGVHPARIRGRLDLAAVGDGVVIDGVVIDGDAIDGAVVRAGDLVVADENGADFLPPASAARAVELAGAREADEQERLARLLDGS
jgi:regulator of RNase E activity RraA